MHEKNILAAGKPLGEGNRVLIMIHGRGGSAEDIISLTDHLKLNDYSILAPQATNHSWYPHSFLAPPRLNEPWLSSALSLLNELLIDITDNGLVKKQIYFLGFSQGACLALEFVTRNASGYGGVIAFTGGLIGDRIYSENYLGDFEGCPIFVGCSDPDPHVPVERVYASVNILRSMNASVTEKIYPNMGHTITQDELDHANRILA
jgi:phospholipase/carboxylesterase